ncbi:guanylate kinase [Nematocida sp. ERTm5]|nr:guanylate kinase [Nematocida sp. ERTm5]
MHFFMVIQTGCSFSMAYNLCINKDFHNKKFMPNSCNTLVIAGASGSGKSTIVRHLLHRYPHKVTISVSYTTRVPREKERDGKDYFFITRDKFMDKIKNNEFIEYAEYAGNYYGTGIEYKTPQTGKILLLEIEKNGVKSIKESGVKAAYVYIYAPESILHERISQRALITQDELSKRLMKAKEENIYGHSSEFDKVIDNTNLNDAINEMESFLKSTFGLN